MKLLLQNTIKTPHHQPIIYDYRFTSPNSKSHITSSTFYNLNSTQYLSQTLSQMYSPTTPPSSSLYNQTIFTSSHNPSQTQAHSPFKRIYLPSFTPSIQDRHKLSSYYETTEPDEEKYFYNKHHKRLTQEEKAAKHFLYRKYNINKNLPIETTSQSITNSISINNTNTNNILSTQTLPSLQDNNQVSIKVKRPFFKNIKKARKAVSINKQIVTRVTEMGSSIQIDKYNSNIETIAHKQKILATMPKVRVKKTTRPKTMDELQEDQKEQLNRNTSKKKSITLAEYILNTFSNGNTTNTNQQPVNPTIQNISNLKMEYSISTQFRAYKPTSRAFCSVCIYNQRLYLFGGLNSKYNNDMWCYSFNTKHWSMIKNISSDDPIPRYGHTGVIMEHYIVIYGGVYNIDYTRTPGDILLFNILTQTFSEPKLMTRIKPGNRKGHIAVGISQSMLIHGGMDTDSNEILRSAYVYTLIKNSWNELEIHNADDLPYLMYHTAVVVNDYSYATIQPYSVYKPPGDLQHNRIKKVKNEGVYVFGGMNRERKLCNDVYIIKICRKPCKIVKARIKGKAPAPRINAKMIYMHEYNMVVIHGGCGNEQKLMNDIAIINVETMSWIYPGVEIEDPNEDVKYLMKRTEHEIFSNGGKIYILGGRDIEQYHKMDFEVVTFQISA